MTTVTLSQSGHTYKVKAAGHAAGSPEVCAAVSALMTTLAGYAENCAVRLEVRLEPGDSEVIFSGGREAAGVYEAMCIGFMQLAASYGDFLQIRK